MPPDLKADRYGATRHRPWSPLVAASALAAVFLGWLAWTAWFHATPDARSELTGYDVAGENTAVGTVDVRLADGVEPADVSCLLRATAYDHTTVGELRFAPRPGRSDYQVRTERRATTVELIGCTTPGQPRPR